MLSYTEVEQSDLGGPPEPVARVFEYDALGRQTATEDNLGGRQEADYDSRHLTVRLRDQFGNVARREYDGLDRLVREERDLTDDGTGAGVVIATQVRTAEWDDASRPVTLTDAGGNTTTMAYDPLDRPIEVVGADGTVRSQTWDPRGNRSSISDENGTVQTFVHDRVGRLVERSVAAAPGLGGTTHETFNYDGASRLVLAQDDDTLLTRAHDSLSNVTDETAQLGADPPRTVLATYDGLSNLTSLTSPSGATVTYTHDPLRRVKTVLDGPALVAQYDYAGPARLVRVTHGNGVVTDYAHDGRRLTTDVHHTGVGWATDHTHAWSAALDRTQDTDSISGTVRDYEYDSLNRLVRSTTTPSGLPSDVVEYDLDAAGNRLAVSGGPDAGVYTKDSSLPEPADAQMNQYTTTSSGARTYDRAGNTLQLDAGLPDERSLTYDYRGRLVQADRGGNVTTYATDALGRYVLRSGTGGSPSSEWSWRGGRELEQSSGGSPEWLVVWGADIRPLMLRELTDVNGNLTLDTYHLHTDDLGNVDAVSDGGGALVESYEYGDYGSPRFFDGSGTPLAASAVGNPFLFRGWRWDEAISLYRDSLGFDPATGRATARSDGGARRSGDARGAYGGDLSDNPTSAGGQCTIFSGGNPGGPFSAADGSGIIDPETPEDPGGSSAKGVACACCLTCKPDAWIGGCSNLSDCDSCCDAWQLRLCGGGDGEALLEFKELKPSY